MYNASLAYENKKFFVRASMNYAGEALDEVGEVRLKIDTMMNNFC